MIAIACTQGGLAMKKVLFYFFLLVLLTGLTGCGGGGSGDTSSGGGSVSPEFVGTYKGTALINVKAFGQTITDSFPITATVANDGRIDVVVNGQVVSTQCNTAAPMFLNGSTYSRNFSITCTDPTLGTCTVTGTESGSVTNTAISGRGSATYVCTAGTFPATVSYTAEKLQAQGLSALSTGNSIFNHAIGLFSRNQ